MQETPAPIASQSAIPHSLSASMNPIRRSRHVHRFHGRHPAAPALRRTVSTGHQVRDEWRTREAATVG
jgi:hypothetical protein